MAQQYERNGRSHAIRRRETIVVYLFLLPALIFFFGFVIAPMIMGIFTGFTACWFGNL